MKNFKTLTTFTFPSELAVAKTKLESEGIECRVLDEHTVQVHNFLSQAVGGIRLQVHESNLEKAWEILEENGLVPIRKEIELSKVEKIVNGSKFQKIIKIIIISLVSITILIGATGFVYMYFNRPTDMDLLTTNAWCVDYINYQNQEYLPYTTYDNIRIRSIFECEEKLNFNKNGNVQFPGFNSPKINGNWKIENNNISIYKIDTLDFLLEREYEYTINRNKLILSSDSLKIYCSNTIN